MKPRLKLAFLSGPRLDQGKTSMVDNLGVPRLLNPIRFEIEAASTGSAKSGVKRIRATELAKLRRALMDLNDDQSLVCDVGGSEYAAFMEGLHQSKSTASEFDRIIFVMKYGSIKQADALGSLLDLFELGAEPSRVSVIFNGAPYAVGLETLRRNLLTEFQAVFESGEALGFHVCTTPVVFADALYKTVFHSPEWTIDGLASAPDFRSQIRSLKKAGQEIPTALYVLESAQENSRSFGKANLDAVWGEIMAATQEGA